MKNRFYTKLTAAVCALALLLSLLPAAAFAADSYMDSGSTSLTKLSKEEIAELTAIQPIASANAPYQSAPSTTQPYAAGTLKQEVLQAGLDRLNALRRIAGLPEVALDSGYTAMAQAAALLNAANNQLSHFPGKPAGMDNSLYNLGKDGAGSSNIAAFMSYTANGPIAYCVDMWMEDSDGSNIDRLGHRRWQLNPRMGKTGWGAAKGGSFSYAAEYSFDNSGAGCDYEFISWPASGNFPANEQLFTGDFAWSVTPNPRKYTVSPGSVTVTLKRESDGKTWTFGGGERYTAASSGKYFNVNTDNYGVPGCIIFRPDGITSYEGLYTVTVSGLRGGSISYQVDFFDPDNYSAGKQPDQPTTPTQPATPTTPTNPTTPTTPTNPTTPSGGKLTIDTMLAAPTFGWNTALKTDGTVWTWDNQNPTPVLKSGIRGKSASAYACIAEDNSLWIWGFKGYQNGSSDYSMDPTPVKVMDNVLYAGINDSGCASALKTDGTLWRWGSGKAPSSAVKVLDDVVQIANPGYDWYALKKDGTLWYAYGYEAEDIEQIGSGYKAFGTGDGGNTIYGIKADGSLWGWGYNDEAQLGQGYASKYQETPVKIMDDVVAVDGRFAITSDGTLYAWGKNDNNWLGFTGGDIRIDDRGTSVVCQSTPRKVMDGVAAVRDSTVLKQDGSLWELSFNDSTNSYGSFQKILDGVKLPGADGGTPSKPDTPTQPTTPATPTTPTQPTNPTTPTTPGGSAGTKNPFTDVPAGAYYTDAVLWALENGVTAGTTATTFEPYTTCTRGQVVTFLWRAKGEPEPVTKNNPFRDVSASSPFYKAILWAAENGITAGTSASTFGPNDTCTNGHVVTFLWRANGKPAASGTSTLAGSFPTDFYTNAVAWADTNGLLKDTGTAFNPGSQSPRANIVTYLYRELAE